MMKPIHTLLKICLCTMMAGGIGTACHRIQNVSKMDAPSKAHFQWTPDQQARFAHKDKDPANWDLATFQDDQDLFRLISWPTMPAMSYIPSPGAKYESPGGSIRNLELEIADKNIYGNSVAWGRGDFNEHLFPNATDRTHVYFNIFILTDEPAPESRANHIVSRNHPHYLSSGKQRTSIGSIDWMQTALASGQNFAIVSARYFDLTFGRTILVAPQQDSTLRFLQLETTPSTHDQDLASYLEELKANPQVVQFFTASGTIE